MSVRASVLVFAFGGVALAAGPKPPPKPTPTPYSTLAKTWHAPSAATAPVDADGRAMLVLHPLGREDRLTLPARSERGGFAAYDLDRAAQLLHDGAGNQHPIEPRLLDVVYRIQTHFSAAEIRVVSGYRAPRAGNGSNHGKGRAIDLVIPGVSDDDVAKFARELGFVGVGIYPASGFVHVDVRERSYFWIDSSGPGKRNRERGILGDLASKSDAAALARGEHGTPPLALVWNVEAAAKAVRDASSAPAVRGASAAPMLDDDLDE